MKLSGIFFMVFFSLSLRAEQYFFAHCGDYSIYKLARGDQFVLEDLASSSRFTQIKKESDGARLIYVFKKAQGRDKLFLRFPSSTLSSQYRPELWSEREFLCELSL